MFEEAINFHQSNSPLHARYKLRELFNLIEQDQRRSEMNRTKYTLEVVNRGRDIYFEENVKCSVVTDQIQVYASRSSITCNGETVLQDFLFCSGNNFLDEVHLDCNVRGEPLYKSLLSKKNGSRHSLLASYTYSNFLDIEDLKRLEEKTIVSFKAVSGGLCLE